LSRDKDGKINDKDVVWVSSTHVEASALSVLTDKVRQDYYAKVSAVRNSVEVPV
jgi:indole-3-glycerol phosphate synthase